MRLDGITSIVGPNDFWALNADTMVRVDGLKDGQTGAYVTSASTFRGTLKDSSGNAIASWNFVNAPAYSGRWEASMLSTDLASLVLNHQYTLEITISANNINAFYKLTRAAKYVTG